MDVEQRNPNDLKPNENNPRRITRKELDKLKHSLREFGFVDPIIVNKHADRKDVVVGGHQRLEAAKAIGLKTVPVTYVDLPRDREEALNIALNRISGDWDEEKLELLVRKLYEDELPLNLTGFDDAELEKLLAKTSPKPSVDEEETPAIKSKPEAEFGCVYQIGEHRVLCGDSTNPEHVAMLFEDDKKADLVWTDPPYGVSYKGTNNPNGKAWDVIEGDDLRDKELHDFLTDLYAIAHEYSKENAALYTCYASSNHTEFETALQNAGWTVKQQLIWHKHHILGRSDYHYNHEPILYAKKTNGPQPDWYGDRSQKTVVGEATNYENQTKAELLAAIQNIQHNGTLMTVSKDPSQSYQHPTQKPVELSKKMILNSTGRGQTVYDPCSGSGSTGIASHLTGRKSRLAEYDPRYADVIIRRLESHTGQKATKLQEAK